MEDAMDGTETVYEEKPMECSDVDEDSNNIDVPLKAVTIVLTGNLSSDDSVLDAARKFGLSVETSHNGEEWIDAPILTAIFVLEEFAGPLYDTLCKMGHRILGPTALKELAEQNKPLPENPRPLYSLAMSGVVVCFTGFRKKEELCRLILLIHHMGGSIRKDMMAKITHLIANCCGGDKYQYANVFRVPIMSATWVHNAWAMRTQVGYNAHQHSVTDHKLKAFHAARVCFLGFPEEERKHMAEILVENGGIHTDIDDLACTHLVLDSVETFELLTKEFSDPLAKRRRCGSTPQFSPPRHHNLEFPPFHNPNNCSTPKSQVIIASVPIKSPTVTVSNNIADSEKSLISLETNNHLDTIHPILKEIDSPSKENSPTNSISRIDTQDTPIIRKRSNNFKTLSPKKDKQTTFKAPRLSIVRRSLRLKSSLARWKSSLDVNFGKQELNVEENLEPENNDKQYLAEIKEDSSINHLVVDESTVSAAPQIALPKARIVKAEWFWASVQNAVCVDEKEHYFLGYVGSMTPRQSIGSATPGSVRARKRKRLQKTLSRAVVGVSPNLDSSSKRRSSITDATLLSCSGSFLDSSPQVEDVDEGPETPRKNLSARHQVFLELLQTESNYVGILNTIMTLFKTPLEEMLEEEDQLLNATELKIIFGHLPPIFNTHSQMLERLKFTAQHWQEELSIGSIFLTFAPDLVKAYPPFVNFFENAREMLIKCDETKPRFHAFLKARQTRVECGRQSLQELLIRPIQRLPSISLLLNDMLKHTGKGNPDHSALESALSSIKEVMTHINEDKRRTEGQMVMFNIFNDIDNCPPHLVSSHRSFICRCDVVELDDSGLSGKGDHLVLFLFTDMLEVCKKRSKAFNSLKSPNTASMGKLTNVKPFKHIKLMSLSTIKRVIDIKETDLCHNVFALMCRSTQDLKEKLYSFRIADDEVDKIIFLKTLCRHTANNACRADAENFLASLDPQTLDIETSDVTLGTFGKAFKFASKTRLKVGRALSFNKTPSKLKRAMSTMMSPFGSTTNLTPATQLAQMRLASCTNINELSSDNPPTQQYVAPMSVQPTRRAKHSSLRRL